MTKDTEVEFKGKFARLTQRGFQLRELFFQSQNEEYAVENDCLSHVFEAGGLDNYQKVATFCEERGITRIFDIGCAYGHQSEVFVDTSIDYVGIDSSVAHFWNADRYTYLGMPYPGEISIPIQKGDLGVSVLCLTWNCYLKEGEKTLREQCEALQRDFEHVLLYMQPEKTLVLLNYFSKMEHIVDNFYYFTR